MSHRADLILALRGAPAVTRAGVADLILDVTLPQLLAFRRLEANDLPFELALSLTPALLEQLSAPDLQARVEATAAQRRRALEAALMAPTEEAARFDLELLDEALELLSALNGDLLGEHIRLRDAGFLELIPGVDAHLPLLNPEGVELEIEAALAAFRRHVGATEGLCLHGCGYTSGVERVLQAQGLRYTFTAPEAVERASSQPRYGRFAPMIFEGSSIVALPADPESLRCLCDAQDHQAYRLRGGLSPLTRVTGATPFKAPYQPRLALEQAEGHARRFLAARQAQAQRLGDLMDQPPLMVAHLPASLFGGRWLEGPYFLEALFELLYVEGEGLRLVTPSRYLMDDDRAYQIARLAPSSVCDQRALCNQKNNWIYPRLHGAARRLMAARAVHGEGLAWAAARARLSVAQRASWAEAMHPEAGLAAIAGIAGFRQALDEAEAAIRAVGGDQ
ncbi:hypothetical protein KKF91_13365 [Myxococcota bacterium]|nr:hypothetical protein [Myxococcota bacterium]MBU1431525.1 hypothetical protein [Myxococcota bacterium]MBU1897996.1 hypothetical protein [Myxococcota bacterium]